MEFTIKNQQLNIIQNLDDQKVDWGIMMSSAPSVWNRTKGDGVRVAVMDTGLDIHHPDLRDNIKGGINFTTQNRSDYIDRNGHGTHCAGIIGAIDNGIGVVGVAPEVELYGVKVLSDRGSGRMEWIIEGIQWCIKNKIDIISMSLGISQEPHPMLHEAIKLAYRHNIAIVCATGNDNNDLDWPAVYPETIAVGAIDVDLEKANFSNFGKEIDVVAGGVNILSTYPPRRYSYLSGTSMATPIISGAVALYIGEKKRRKQSYSVADIHIALREHSIDLGIDGYDDNTGHGMLNLPRLLK